jgi:hypothetical protein
MLGGDPRPAWGTVLSSVPVAGRAPSHQIDYKTSTTALNPAFLDDKPRVRSCKEQDGLIGEWAESILALRSSVARLSLHVGDDAVFRQHFQATAQAKENVSEMRSALELHIDRHGC